MKISYKKLFELMNEKGVEKEELITTANISYATFEKLENDGNVNVDELARICITLDCTLDDIMEIVPENDRTHL